MVGVAHLDKKVGNADSGVAAFSTATPSGAKENRLVCLNVVH